MIVLTRPPESSTGDDIVAALQDMVVAFRVVEDPLLDSPTLHDGDVRAQGPDEIAVFLSRLRHDLRQWNAHQSDACFIDDDGSVC